MASTDAERLAASVLRRPPFRADRDAADAGTATNLNRWVRRGLWVGRPFDNGRPAGPTCTRGMVGAVVASERAGPRGREDGRPAGLQQPDFTGLKTVVTSIFYNSPPA